MTSTVAPANPGENLNQIPAEADAPGASDAVVFARLETQFGGELATALNFYLENSDALNERLEEAMACAYWQEAVRVALKLGQEADAMGFHRIAAVARALADATYHADNGSALRNEAQLVMLEYGRFRLALMARFSNLLAPVAASVA
jgi:hypothetical protein